jgi:hypothetical protein
VRFLFIFKQLIPIVIVRLDRAPSIPEMPALEPRGRGVLDRPLSRAMTIGGYESASRAKGRVPE